MKPRFLQTGLQPIPTHRGTMNATVSLVSASAPKRWCEQLADGPKPGAQIEAAAQAAEIPIRSLIVAADALGARTQRGQWWLPA